ncbi:MAG: PAS domain S-box protein [Pseudomonadota bacterium]|nr:MAG: PAS domain S-box protein [Pseudomonadota bacterium]
MSANVISRNHFDHILSNLSNALVVTDRRGRVETINAAACRVLGCSVPEVTGQPAERILPDEVCQRLSGAAAFRDLEIELRDPAGHITPVLMSGEPLPKEEGGWVIVATDITERRKAEEALRRSEERYRQVIDNVSEAIVILQGTHVVFANPRLKELTGYTDEDLAARPFIQFFHSDDQPAAMDRYVRRLRGEAVERYTTFRLMRKDGSSIWIGSSAVLIPWEGKPATLAFLADVSEMRATEEALRRSEERYRQVIENVSEGILVAQDARIVFVNPSLQHMMGYTEDELLHKEFLPFVYPDDRAMVMDRYVRRMRGESVETRYDCRVLNKAGDPVWVELAAVIIQWEGRPGTLSFVSDITARKRFEDELRLIKERYDVATAVGKVGTWDWNPATGALHWSDETFRLMGYAPGAVTPTYELYLGLVHPDDRKMLNAAVVAALNERRPYDLDCRIVLADGTPLVCHVTGKVEFAPDGRPVRMLGTIQDVTARKQAEQEIQMALEKQKELNYLKSRFVSMTSHEFRTPLATILSSAELLKNYGEKLPASERAELLVTTESAVKRMTALLDDVLIIGKAETGRLEFHPTVVALRHFCEALAMEVAMASEQEGGTRHDIDLEVNGDCETAWLDEKLLRHILGNLLSNAIKYSPGGGRVRFEVQGRADGFEFVVADRGIGVPVEEQPRLFETFFRARNVGNISGTGLGLAIVKHAVDLHGGSISFESKPGQGTRFAVTLPRAGGGP